MKNLLDIVLSPSFGRDEHGKFSKVKPFIGQLCLNSVQLFKWTELHDKIDVINTLIEYKNTSPKHIHILSDDKIEEGDCYYNTETKLVCNTLKYDYHKVVTERFPSLYKKIVLTTDTSLNLPIIPDFYVDEFEEKYNSGDIPLKVVCDYNSDYFYSGVEDSGIKEVLTEEPCYKIVKLITEKNSFSGLPIDSIITIVNSLNTPIFKRKFGEDSVIMESISELNKWLEENNINKEII